MNTLDQLHDSAATRPASVEMSSISKAGYHDGHDIGEVPDMGQMVAELRAEVRLGLQAGLEAGLQQAHQAFDEFEPIVPVQNPDDAGRRFNLDDDRQYRVGQQASIYHAGDRVRDRRFSGARCVRQVDGRRL